MRALAPLLSLLCLAFATVQASKGHLVCTTAACNLPGFRTSSLPDQTFTLIKRAPPCYTTSVKTIQGTSTITSVTPFLSTTVVTAARRTDVYTVTSTSLAVTLPTTTTIVASTTPTVLVTIFIPSTETPVVTTVTSYTAASGPTPGAAGERRSEDLLPSRLQGRGREDQPDLYARLKESKKRSGHPKAAMKGKLVYCHQQYTTTVTSPLKCTTVGSTTRLPKATVTSTSVLTIPVTSTQVPKDATSVSTVYISSTMTAPTITFAETFTAAPVASIVTSTSPQISSTVVVNGFASCNPDRYREQVYDFDYGTDAATTAPDAFTCCNIAAAQPGAVYFTFELQDNSCGYHYVTEAGQCPMSGYISNCQGCGIVSAELQCGV